MILRPLTELQGHVQDFHNLRWDFRYTSICFDNCLLSYLMQILSHPRKIKTLPFSICPAQNPRFINASTSFRALVMQEYILQNFRQRFPRAI